VYAELPKHPETPKARPKRDPQPNLHPVQASPPTHLEDLPHGGQEPVHPRALDHVDVHHPPVDIDGDDVIRVGDGAEAAVHQGLVKVEHQRLPPGVRAPLARDDGPRVGVRRRRRRPGVRLLGRRQAPAVARGVPGGGGRGGGVGVDQRLVAGGQEGVDAGDDEVVAVVAVIGCCCCCCCCC